MFNGSRLFIHWFGPHFIRLIQSIDGTSCKFKTIKNKHLTCDIETVILITWSCDIATKQEVMTMIKARVYEQQWGGFVSDYIQYFSKMSEIKELKLRTGWRIVIENKNIY